MSSPVITGHLRVVMWSRCGRPCRSEWTIHQGRRRSGIKARSSVTKVVHSAELRRGRQAGSKTPTTKWYGREMKGAPNGSALLSDVSGRVTSLPSL